MHKTEGSLRNLLLYKNAEHARLGEMLFTRHSLVSLKKAENSIAESDYAAVF